MRHVRDFDIAFSDAWLVVLLVPVLVYLAWQVYRPQPGTQASRWLLAVRVGALVLLAALFLEPVVAVTLQGTRKPMLALLVDGSASMRVQEDGRPRWRSVEDLAAHAAMRGLDARSRLRSYRFSDTFTEGPPAPADTALWNGRGTDLAGAFEALQQETTGEGLVGVVVITDGGHNLGGNPSQAAAELGVPVYAIGVGDPAPPHDIALESGTVEPVAYVGRPLDLDLRIVSNGFDGLPMTVIVSEEGQEPVETPVVLQEGEQEVSVTVRPKRTGRRVFRVSIPSRPGEHTSENNTLLLSTDVLEGKRRVFIAAGRPSPDLGYLRRVLASDPNIEVDVWTWVRSGSWSGETPGALRDPSPYELVVLLDVPGGVLQGSVGSGLVTYVQDGGGLLVAGGPDALDRSYVPAPIAGILPVRLEPEASWVEEPATLRVPAAAAEHPVLRGHDARSVQQAWEELPPVLAYNRTGALQAGAEALLVHPNQTAGGAPMPLASVRRVGQGKTMVVAARTFWRLGLMMWGIGKTDALSRGFWRNSAKWLMTRDDMSRVRTSTDRAVYRGGEPVRVFARVFSELMEPVGDARVQATVRRVGADPDDEAARRVLLVPTGEGRYSGTVGGFPQGDYAYEVTATLDDPDLGDPDLDHADPGRAEGRFTVGRYSLEYDDVRMNEELLRDVADNSGGSFLLPEAAPAFLDSLQLPEQPTTSTYRASLWGRRWPFFLLLGLFTLEWAVRRRRGMV